MIESDLGLLVRFAPLCERQYDHASNSKTENNATQRSEIHGSSL